MGFLNSSLLNLKKAVSYLVFKSFSCQTLMCSQCVSQPFSDAMKIWLQPTLNILFSSNNLIKASISKCDCTWGYKDIWLQHIYWGQLEERRNDLTHNSHQIIYATFQRKLWKAYTWLIVVDYKRLREWCFSYLLIQNWKEHSSEPYGRQANTLPTKVFLSSTEHPSPEKGHVFAMQHLSRKES